MISVFYEWSDDVGRRVIVQAYSLDTQLIVFRQNYDFFSFKNTEISKSTKTVVCHTESSIIVVGYQKYLKKEIELKKKNTFQ